MTIKQLLKNTSLYKWYIQQLNKRVKKRKKKLNDAFQKEGLSVLRCFSNALNNEGVMFWLNFGTLLGYYREHDFIKHDYDLDTGAWYYDRGRVKKTLEKAGFERVRYYYLQNKDGLEECYKHKDYNTTIDVFYFITEEDKSFCYSFAPCVSMRKKRNLNKLQPSKVMKWTYDVFTLVPVDFKGIRVFVPKDTVRFLTSLYGETFMTPIPDFPVKGRPNMTEYSFEEEPGYAFLKIGYL